MIQTVLLLPADGDPLHLLDASVIGSAPPVLPLCNADERAVGGGWHAAAPPCREHPRSLALVLARDGKAVPSGVFAAWFQSDGLCDHDPDPGGAEGLSIALYDGIPALVEWAASLRRDGSPLGSIVLLDGGGMQITRPADA